MVDAPLLEPELLVLPANIRGGVFASCRSARGGLRRQLAVEVEDFFEDLEPFVGRLA
jgi:hypothetical protein